MSRVTSDTSTNHAGLEVYMSYLLRYVSFPVSKQDLKKKATVKKFNRLAGYIDSLPEDCVYSGPEVVMQDLQNLN